MNAEHANACEGRLLPLGERTGVLRLPHFPLALSPSRPTQMRAGSDYLMPITAHSNDNKLNRYLSSSWPMLDLQTPHAADEDIHEAGLVAESRAALRAARLFRERGP